MAARIVGGNSDFAMAINVGATSAIDRTSEFRFSQGAASSSKRSRLSLKRSPMDRCGTSHFRGIRSSSSSTSPTAPTNTSTSLIAIPRDRVAVRNRRPRSRPVLWCAQHCRRLGGQHLHYGNVYGQATPKIRVQGHGRAAAWHPVADGQPPLTRSTDIVNGASLAPLDQGVSWRAHWPGPACSTSTRADHSSAREPPKPDAAVHVQAIAGGAERRRNPAVCGNSRLLDERHPGPA